LTRAGRYCTARAFIDELKHPRRNFCGRRKDKTLKKSQEVYFISRRPCGPISQAGQLGGNPDRAPLDLAVRFDGKPILLEVAFGEVQHMVHQAAQYPNTGIIDAEPYINGIAMLLDEI